MNTGFVMKIGAVKGACGRKVRALQEKMEEGA